MAAAGERTELVVRERHAMSTEPGGALSGSQLKFISNTDFVPAGLRGNMPAILACVATGRALGLADMTSLRSIHIIDGKAAFSAELMVSLIRRKGHSITGVVTAEKATVTGKRRDTGDEMTAEFTLAMAERAGLLSKPGWKKYPESYLWARAASQLGRMLFADCFAGASYTPEELGAGDVTADELMDEEPVVAPVAGGDAPLPEPEPDPEDEQAGELVAEEDDATEDSIVEVSREGQRDRLLELVTSLSDARPDVNWSATLTQKIRKDFNVKSYNDLTDVQLGEVLSFLEGELPQRKAS